MKAAFIIGLLAFTAIVNSQAPASNANAGTLVTPAAVVTTVGGNSVSNTTITNNTCPPGSFNAAGTIYTCSSTAGAVNTTYNVSILIATTYPTPFVCVNLAPQSFMMVNATTPIANATILTAY